MLAGLMAATPLTGADLSPRTLQAFAAYMETADRSMTARASGDTRVALPASGEPVIQPWEGQGPREVYNGLIHDWIAAAFVPKAKLSAVVAVLQDVDNYYRIYAPDVVKSRLLSRDDNHFHIYLRVVKHNVITVVLDTYYDVEYRTYPNGREQMWSRSTRISEVEDAGKPSERVKPPDTGYGFLWRLNTYWQLEERNGGVYMECRAISLTRDIPFGLSWIIKPMVTSLPRESLLKTMQDTRRAVEARTE